jgi:hypothetical protein
MQGRQHATPETRNPKHPEIAGKTNFPFHHEGTKARINNTEKK